VPLHPNDRLTVAARKVTFPIAERAAVERMDRPAWRRRHCIEMSFSTGVAARNMAHVMQSETNPVKEKP
jgi:hypothetical protein